MLNVFHKGCLRRILGITWQDKVTNEVVLEKAGIPSLYILKAKVHAMAGTCDTDGRQPHFREPLYGELATGKRPTGLPHLRFKDVCKRDLQALGINSDSWKLLPQTEMLGDTQ